MAKRSAKKSKCPACGSKSVGPWGGAQRCSACGTVFTEVCFCCHGKMPPVILGGSVNIETVTCPRCRARRQRRGRKR